MTPLSRILPVAAFVPLAAALVIAAPALADSPLRFENTTINLGPISDTRASIEVFRFTNTSDRPVRPVYSGCHHCESITFDKPVYQPGESGVAMVPINPAGRRGPLTAGGSVFAEGLPGSEVRVTVTAEVRPRAFADPATSFFGDVVRARGATTTFTVYGRKKDFTVTAAEPDSPLVTAAIGEPREDFDAGEPVRAYPITLAILPGAPLGPLAASIRIANNDPDSLPVLHTITAEIVGDVTFDPPVVLAGNRSAGQPFDASFTLLSRSGDPVDLASLDIADAARCTAVVLDARSSADRRRWTVTVRGLAPVYPTQYLSVIVAAETVSPSGERETLSVPIGMSVKP